MIVGNNNTVALWGAWKPEYLELVNDVLERGIDDDLINKVGKLV